VKLDHSFNPHRDDRSAVTATLVGVMDFEPEKKRIRLLQIVTDKATYSLEGRSPSMGVALRSVVAPVTSR